MPDPNTLPFSVGVETKTIVSAPGPVTTILPAPPFPLGFIRVDEIVITSSATGVVTLSSVGSYFPDRTLGTYQVTAGNPIVLPVSQSAAGGHMDCDPGSALRLTNTAGTVSGTVRYSIRGVP